jgi:hypothetical protein
MEQTEEQEDRSLEAVVGGPYTFPLKDGTLLSLDEWTIDAEKWAKKHYGTMQKLYNALMNIGVEDDVTIDAAINIAIYRLTDESRALVEERRGELTSEDWLRKQITYKNFADLCRAEYSMIKDSIPIELLSAVKKNPMVMKHNTQTQGKTKKTK